MVFNPLLEMWDMVVESCKQYLIYDLRCVSHLIMSLLGCNLSILLDSDMLI